MTTGFKSKYYIKSITVVHLQVINTVSYIKCSYFLFLQIIQFMKNLFQIIIFIKSLIDSTWFARLLVQYYVWAAKYSPTKFRYSTQKGREEECFWNLFLFYTYKICLCEGQPGDLEHVQETHTQVSVPADQLMPSNPCHWQYYIYLSSICKYFVDTYILWLCL